MGKATKQKMTRSHDMLPIDPKKSRRVKHPNKSKPLSKGWNQRRKAKTLAAKKARRLNRRKRN